MGKTTLHHEFRGLPATDRLVRGAGIYIEQEFFTTIKDKRIRYVEHDEYKIGDKKKEGKLKQILGLSRNTQLGSGNIVATRLDAYIKKFLKIKFFTGVNSYAGKNFIKSATVKEHLEELKRYAKAANVKMDKRAFIDLKKQLIALRQKFEAIEYAKLQKAALQKLETHRKNGYLLFNMKHFISNVENEYAYLMAAAGKDAVKKLDRELQARIFAELKSWALKSADICERECLELDVKQSVKGLEDLAKRMKIKLPRGWRSQARQLRRELKIRIEVVNKINETRRAIEAENLEGAQGYLEKAVLTFEKKGIRSETIDRRISELLKDFAAGYAARMAFHYLVGK